MVSRVKQFFQSFNDEGGHLGFYHEGKDIKDKYVLHSEELGRGANGPVLKATARDGSGDFAVKTVERSSPFSEKEVEIFASLNHKNVAKLIEVFAEDSEVQDSKVHLVMELLTGGNLFDRILERGGYSEEDAAGALSQICEALFYLHTRQCPIVHRDLKPENCVYLAPGSDELKLVDFELSIEWNKQEKEMFWAEENKTLEYAPPEFILEEGSTEKCDIFSLGVILYVILTGDPPFEGDALHMERCKPWEQERFLSLSNDAQSLLKSMLDFDPNKRPSAKSILENSWLNATRRDAVAEPVQLEVKTGIRASRFKRACLNMLAWSLSLQDLEELRKCFAKKDAGQVGKLPLIEFRDVLYDEYSIDNAEAGHIFATIQPEDNPGEICYTDFLAAVLRERVRLHQKTVYSLWTTLAGSDSEASIAATALQAILPGQSDSDKATVAAIINELDPGCTGEVSFQSFQAFIRSLVISHEAGVAIVDEDMKRKYTELVVRLIDNDLGGEHIGSDNSYLRKTTIGKKPKGPSIRSR